MNTSENPTTDKTDLKLEFTHHGVTRALVKHPAVRLALKRGTLTLEEARRKPWYLRFKLGTREQPFKLSATDKDAIREAKDKLNGRVNHPEEFAEFMKARQSRRGVTCGQLAADWTAAGYPDENGRPRSPEAAGRMAHDLEIALRWWNDIPAVTAPNRWHDFIAWRRSNSKRGPGDRAADLDLNALSCLCQWAVFVRKLEKNPFEDRPTFHDKEKTRHCSDCAPESDEAVHKILAWFFTPRPAPACDRLKPEDARERLERHRVAELERIVAGAWLTWCNLTGIRAAEPFYLARHAALNQEPHRPDQLSPGTVFPFIDGRSMKVFREKRGQNPFVTLHSAAADFLKTWTLWLETNLPRPTGAAADVVFPWFPNPSDLEKPFCPLRLNKGKLQPDTSYVNDLLSQACRDTGLPHYTPSGFGRAYYTRVRKSQRASNAVIAEELGQTTLGKLIRTTYGKGTDMFGSHRYDWLPQDEKQQPLAAAWKLLTGTAADNIIAL